MGFEKTERRFVKVDESRAFRLRECPLGELPLYFGFAIEREIRKRISTLKYLFLDSLSFRFFGKSEKGFEKQFLRTAVLHVHASLAKRKPDCSRE